MKMIFPSICVDNFFNNTDEVLKIAESCRYEKVNYIPGERSLPLHLTHKDFFNYLNLKILSVLYPNEEKNIIYKAKSMFQKIPSNIDYDGWVHNDDKDMLTCIIYLTDSNAGTSLYKPKNPFFVQDGLDKDKHNFFENYEKYDTKELEKIKNTKEQWNNYFTETVSFKGQFNRMICFDGSNYHAAHIHKGDNDRLTLVSFFNDISLLDKKINYPIPTLKKP